MIYGKNTDSNTVNISSEHTHVIVECITIRNIVF